MCVGGGGGGLHNGKWGMEVLPLRKGGKKGFSHAEGVGGGGGGGGCTKGFGVVFTW